GEHREDTEADGEVAPPRPRDGGVQGASAMDGDETPGARREPVFAADAAAPGRTRRSPLEAGRRILSVRLQGWRPTVSHFGSAGFLEDPKRQQVRGCIARAKRNGVRVFGGVDRMRNVGSPDDGEVVVREASVSEISPLQIGEARARQV